MPLKHPQIKYPSNFRCVRSSYSDNNFYSTCLVEKLQDDPRKEYPEHGFHGKNPDVFQK
ncbi:MAG: hypothetical protein ACTSXK_13990 [Promethearchaeota archaeon]